MELCPGELFDKLSIVQLKAERLDEPLACRLVKEELLELEAAFGESKQDNPLLAVRHEDMLQLLKIANGFIWDLEADIRQGKEGVLGMEEVGRRALMIRDLNSIRVWAKNLITRATGQGRQEIKKDHASAVMV